MTGESVLTDGVKVRNNEAALVGLGAGESQMQWHSGLARAETLEVSLPADAARTEVWSFVVNPQWNVAFEGFAPVLPENVNAPAWVFRFMPRPGEKLDAQGHAAQGREGHHARHRLGEPGDRRRQALVDHHARSSAIAARRAVVTSSSCRWTRA